MTSTVPPFHLAIPVDDLEKARAFYGGLLGCHEGRSSDRWVDFNFYGHQLVVHLATPIRNLDGNTVDGKQVPSMHFGVVLEWDHWHALATRLEASGIDFLIEPCVRFEGKAGEQATMFFKDPAGNAIEIKSFQNMGHLFMKDDGDG